MVKKVVAVQNYGASGTTFVESLLDNHPEMLTLPALYSRDLLVTLPDIINSEDSINAFMKKYAYWFTPELVPEDLGLRKLGDNLDQSALVPPSSFKQALTGYLANFDKPTLKNYMDGIYTAYSIALGRKIDGKHTILYSFHSLDPKYANLLSSLYGEVKFLHMVREPIQNMGSLMKHISHNDKWFTYNLLECAISQLCNDEVRHGTPFPYSVKAIEANVDSTISQSRSLRLEDLHLYPRATLTSLCDWIDIRWSDTLLESTFNGQKWWNRPESKQVSGFSNQIISQKHYKFISRFDRLRLQALTRCLNKSWSYSDSSSNIILSLAISPLFLIPFKTEFHIWRELKTAKYYKFCLVSAYKTTPKTDIIEYKDRFLASFPRFINYATIQSTKKLFAIIATYKGRYREQFYVHRHTAILEESQEDARITFTTILVFIFLIFSNYINTRKTIAIALKNSVFNIKKVVRLIKS